jgi:hypothetical protein
MFLDVISGDTATDTPTRALQSATDGERMRRAVATVDIGTLFMSDSRGTGFSLTLPDTSHAAGGAGPEVARVPSVDGVLLANQVANPAEARAGLPARVRTRISWDAGAQWAPLAPPPIRVDGSAWACTAPSGNCTLHLYTNVDGRFHECVACLAFLFAL